MEFTTSGYSFDGYGALQAMPPLWHVDTMPYRYELDRWTAHLYTCGQCAQHQHEVAELPDGSPPATEPCQTGLEMLAEYQFAVRQTRRDAMAN